MSSIYAPSKSLSARVNRRLTPFQAKRNLNLNLDRPIISITFDDCPKSVIQNAVPLIEQEGWQASLYMAMGLCGFTNHLGLHMSEDDVKAAYASGHEIADHTFSHVDATTISLEELKKEINKNQARINELGLPPSQTFAYPYGQTNVKIKKYMEKKFKGARGITSRVHRSTIDLNQINSNRLYSGQKFDSLAKEISDLKQNPGWMTIYTHDVRDTPSQFGCTPEEFKHTIEAIKNSGARVMTVANAIDFLESNHAS